MKNINLADLECDIVVNDTGYYDQENNQLKFLWYNFENKSSFSYYFWNYKFQIIWWEEFVKLNPSVVYKYDSNWNLVNIYTWLFVPNYKYFCKSNFSIPAWKTVRILTTAEEIGEINCWNFIYKTKFLNRDWKLENWITDSANWVLPGNFTFYTPILSIIWHSDNIDNSIFSFKMWVLFDKDNNLQTIEDNFVKIVCYNLKIWWCWDGIVEKQFWEECDPKAPNWDKCQSNCKLVCLPSENDVDWDCISNDDDLAPTIPEDPDGIEDWDGIPDIPCLFWQCFPNWLTKVNCNMCPCPMADYLWDLRWGDRVKATLWDKEGKIFYTQSEEKKIEK